MTEKIVYFQANQGKTVSAEVDQKLKASILEKWVVTWISNSFKLFHKLILDVTAMCIKMSNQMFEPHRYMLVDNEEDKKVHRPLTPKDVCFSVIALYNINELRGY